MVSKGYRDLLVWQKAINLVAMIYTAAKHFPKNEMYGLTNQMQRCAVSIPSNIAEGHGRSSNNDFRRFLYISLGSLAELDTQLEIAKRISYIELEESKSIDEKISQIRKMLYGLVNSLS
jgi:four helix bundle protein